MSYPINYPTPQNANVQVLYKTDDWVKPQGTSFVWFTLIGAGAGGRNDVTGSGGVGGGSGAVTNFMCPAFLIPDELRIVVGIGGAGGATGTDTTVVYQEKDGTGYTLLTGSAGTSQTAGTAMTANYFTAMGFFQSIAGQDGGTTSADLTASTTTFLSGGGAGTYATFPNYGYPPGAKGAASTENPGFPGYFMMRPIIVGAGGGPGGWNPGGSLGGRGGMGGIGCGGGGAGAGSSPGAVGGRGGDGLAVIITW